MKNKNLRLVGIQVAHSKYLHLYHIDNVYSQRIGDEDEDVAMMRGFDMQLFAPFEDVTHSIMDAYAATIQHIWKCENGRAEFYYLQLADGLSPWDVGLSEQWLHWAEK